MLRYRCVIVCSQYGLCSYGACRGHYRMHVVETCFYKFEKAKYFLVHQYPLSFFEHKLGMINIRKLALNFCKGFISCWINASSKSEFDSSTLVSYFYLIGVVVSCFQVVTCFFGSVHAYFCILPHTSSGSID